MMNLSWLIFNGREKKKRIFSLDEFHLHWWLYKSMINCRNLSFDTFRLEHEQLRPNGKSQTEEEDFPFWFIVEQVHICLLWIVYWKTNEKLSKHLGACTTLTIKHRLFISRTVFFETWFSRNRLITCKLNEHFQIFSCQVFSPLGKIFERRIK